MDEANRRLEGKGLNYVGQHLGEAGENDAQAIIEYALKVHADLICVVNPNSAGEIEKRGSISDHLVNLSPITVLSCRADHRAVDLA